MTLIIDDVDLTRYLQLKNSILYLLSSDEFDKELAGKAINIFNQEILDLEETLTDKGYIFDFGVCATSLHLPLIYVKNKNGEFEEQGFRVTELEAIWDEALIRRYLPALIAEIRKTPVKPMLDA
ncbi:MAG: hypothetical protein RR677_12030 [Acinetobacter sp.]